MLKKSFLVIVIILVAACVCNAQVPHLFNYQGFLRNASGTPVTGSRSIEFRIYNTATGGTAQWTETQTVTITDGIFNVLLGSVVPIPYSVFDGDDRYLALKIGSDPEMVPRKRFASVGYAFHSNNADSLGGFGSSSFVKMDQPNSISTAMVQDNGVTAEKILPDIVSSVEGVTNDGGNIDLVEGRNITIAHDNGANTITISASGGTGGGDITAVTAGTGLRGGGTSGDVTLSIADGGVTKTKLSASAGTSGQVLSTDGTNLQWQSVGNGDITAVNAGTGLTGGAAAGNATLDVGAGTGITVSADAVSLNTSYTDAQYVNEGQANSITNAMMADNSVGSAEVANGSLTASDLSVNVLSSLDGVTHDGGNIDLVAGSNITITPDDPSNKITISASGGGGGDITAVNAGTGLIGGGTSGDVTLFVAVPLILSGSVSPVIKATDSGSGNYGYLGHSTYGVVGSSSTNIGVYGTSNSGSGVEGTCNSSSGGSGVYGFNNSSGNSGYLGNSSSGVYGYNTSGNSGFLGGNNYGVYGHVGNNHGSLGSSSDGVLGSSSNNSGSGVAGIHTGSGNGVYGRSSSGYAGYFSGDVHVTGTITKGAGSFTIDHPLDPENKYLQHSFVESPDMKNVYDGVVVLNADGEAIVEFPVWFEVLNKDFRYQLTCIGGFAQVYIAEEISNNHFRIAGGRRGMKVSWQVTGIRHDAYANAHRIQVEVEKTGAERGKYLHPKENGVSETLGIDYAEVQKMEEENKKMEKQNKKIGRK